MRLTMSQFHETPEYRSLTPKQRVFVDTWLTNGYDATAASSAAYICKNERVARINGYNLLKRHTVIMALNTFFNDDPVNQFLAVLWRMIQRNQLSENTVRAMTLYAEVNGWRKSKNPNAGLDKAKDAVEDDEPPLQNAPSPLSQILSEFETDK